NTRYVEFAKAGGQNDELCSSGGINGAATLWTMQDNITAPEGDWSFWNIHDYASGQGAMEIGRTMRAEDTRPNYPITFRHWYIHDSDREISATPCTRHAMARGISIVVDSASDLVRGLTFDGFHFARQHTGYSFTSSGSGTTIIHKNILLRNFLIHDSPQV